MSVKTNVLAYTFFKYTPSCVASGRKYVDSCGNKGLDETRRSQTERLISRPRKHTKISSTRLWPKSCATIFLIVEVKEDRIALKTLEFVAGNWSISHSYLNQLSMLDPKRSCKKVESIR